MNKVTRESLGLEQDARDPYLLHRDKLVEANIVNCRFIGYYLGLDGKNREIVLFPSLAWDTNEHGKPMLKMNNERPRYVALNALNSIGPVSESYLEFYIKEQLKQYLANREKVKSDRQQAEQ
jgi:hypothetical protein